MKSFPKAPQMFSAVVLVASLSGCATILRGTEHGVGIATAPAGAEVIVDNQNLGVTPVAATLRRKDNHHIVIRMDGYEPYELMLTRQTSGWMFGNILFGPGVLIGIAVDAIAGGMYSLKPDQVHAELQTGAAPKVALTEGMLHVILTPKVDSAWVKVGQMQKSLHVD